MAARPTITVAGVTAAAVCAGLLSMSGQVDAAPRQGVVERDPTVPRRALVARQGPAVPGRGVVARPRPTFVQIIAHPADDLLFMSPDLPRDIAAGDDVTTVVLTAGEGRAGLASGTRDRLAYVADRRQGLHAAYAAMAGVRDAWRVGSVRSGRARIETHMLVARPGVRLAFLSLPDGRDPRSNLGRRTLARLYADGTSGVCARTVTAVRSPYAFCYTRADVIRALVTMLRITQPTVVRAQDPEPDRRYAGDDADHVAAARFAAAAVQAYRRPVAQVGYRDGDIRALPVNLGRAGRMRKQRALVAYRRHDRRLNPESADAAPWQERMRHRSPWGTWVARGADGRSQAFVVLSGRLYMWWQTASGGWAGPVSLGGRGLAPSLAVAGGRVFALRDGRIVTARPRPVDGRWTATWTTVGGFAAGPPVAVTGRDGRIAVFARAAAGGVGVACQTARGGWPRTWTALRGPARRAAYTRPGIPSRNRARPALRDVQDGMSAVGGPAGIELFAPTRRGVLQWRQTGRCAFGHAVALPGVRPAGPLTATRDASGHPTLLYEEAGSAALRQIKETGRMWSPPAIPLRAVYRAPGEAPIPLGTRVPPPAPGVPVVGVPAVVADGTGRSYAVAFGANGRLYVTIRGDSGTYGNWAATG